MNKKHSQILILVAEDNSINQLVAKAMLDHFGAAADLVSNGFQAIEAFKQKNYDLILMDCQMPQMDGYEATRRIREIEQSMALSAESGQPRARIPIVALTGQAMTGDRERCLAAGMDDYLAKPFNLKQLQAVLKRLLP